MSKMNSNTTNTTTTTTTTITTGDENNIMMDKKLLREMSAKKVIIPSCLREPCLSIIVVGASGDLAKKKTYPSLLNLFVDNLLPNNTRIWGYARSTLTNDELRERLKPYLKVKRHNNNNNNDATPKNDDQIVDEFLNLCYYQGGESYGDIRAFRTLSDHIKEYEDLFCNNNKDNNNNNNGNKTGNSSEEKNRLFYFAIPPNVFADTALAIKQTCMQTERYGWTRLIIEKPFGKDLKSFEILNETLSKHFTEKHIYRIDHYLGKEMVQNLLVLRFSNVFFEQIWNRHHVQCVILTFKEPFGTEGRGGYFDQYGIIRDILQNHLLQVLTLLAMEAPITADGIHAGKCIRDNKVAVLNAIEPIRLDDVVLGQYEHYADDPTIKNKNTNCPTFACIRLFVNTPRWDGVPFILKAGKALNERKAEMRIQFKDPPAANYIFQESDCPRNELVMKMQPDETVYMKTNVKSPGFDTKPIQSELQVNYDTRFLNDDGTSMISPDAYTRLILDVLQGKQSAFVRDDELRRAWEIFTPILHEIEKNDGNDVKPIIYKQGTRGPKEADEFMKEKAGYKRSEDYFWPHK